MRTGLGSLAELGLYLCIVNYIYIVIKSVFETQLSQITHTEVTLINRRTVSVLRFSNPKEQFFSFPIAENANEFIFIHFEQGSVVIKVIHLGG